MPKIGAKWGQNWSTNDLFVLFQIVITRFSGMHEAALEIRKIFEQKKKWHI